MREGQFGFPHDIRLHEFLDPGQYILEHAVLFRQNWLQPQPRGDLIRPHILSARGGEARTHPLLHCQRLSFPRARELRPTGIVKESRCPLRKLPSTNICIHCTRSLRFGSASQLDRLQRRTWKRLPTIQPLAITLSLLNCK